MVKRPIVNTDGVIHFEDGIIADRAIPSGGDEEGVDPVEPEIIPEW